MTKQITKNLIPVAIVVAGLLVVGALVYVNQGSSADIGAKKAGEKTITYINENILSSGTVASLVDISDTGSVYKIRLEIRSGEEFLGEFESYVSKDGKFLFPEGGIDMDEVFVQDFGTQTPEQQETPSLPQEELDNLVGCLKDAGMMIYGEDWCPYCQQVVAMFGGKETVAPIYVDCGEQAELCYDEKGIVNVPAIFINGNEYAGARSLEAFAQETGCILY